MFLKTSALRVSMDLSNIIRALVDVEHLVSAAKEVTTKRETGHTHTRRHLLHQTFSFAIEQKKQTRVPLRAEKSCQSFSQRLATVSEAYKRLHSLLMKMK